MVGGGSIDICSCVRGCVYDPGVRAQFYCTGIVMYHHASAVVDMLVHIYAKVDCVRYVYRRTECPAGLGGSRWGLVMRQGSLYNPCTPGRTRS
jgi:hypothetical protein